MLTCHSTDLCEECCNASTETLANLNYRIRSREQRLKHAHEVCASCTNIALSDIIHCESLDCQWFYARRKAEIGMELVPLLADASEDLEEAICEIEEARGEAYFEYDIHDMDDAEKRESESPAPLVDDWMDE